MKCETLVKFRQLAYELLGPAKDATFELLDAVMTTPRAKCLADFSLNPLFRRQWSSVYEALQDARPEPEQLMQLYIKQMSAIDRPILAVDHTLWSRPHARTLKERTYEHQPAVLPGHTPVGVGLGYSTIAWIPEAQGSWALPLRHERISSWDTPITKAASQLKQVLEHLPHRPLVLFDREYGCAPLVLETAGLRADKLMRLRSNRCLYAAPPTYSGRGRPRLHGEKFKLNDQATWWADDGSVELEDTALGRLRRRQWQNLHFGASATHPMTLILLERKEGASNARQAQPLWWVWVGENLPPLAEIGQLYLRRFAIDHWYRLAKQTLFWTQPQLSTTEQCDRWSTLMPLLTWQLWLARDLVRDFHLPQAKSSHKFNSRTSGAINVSTFS